MNPIILYLGRNIYVKSPPSGSVLGESLRLIRFAGKGRWSFNPIRTVKNLKAADFWENAKPSKLQGEEKPRWMTFDDAWVDEVRRVSRQLLRFGDTLHVTDSYLFSIDLLTGIQSLSSICLLSSILAILQSNDRKSNLSSRNFTDQWAPQRNLEQPQPSIADHHDSSFRFTTLPILQKDRNQVHSHQKNHSGIYVCVFCYDLGCRSTILCLSNVSLWIQRWRYHPRRCRRRSCL